MKFVPGCQIVDAASFIIHLSRGLSNVATAGCVPKLGQTLQNPPDSQSGSEAGLPRADS